MKQRRTSGRLLPGFLVLLLLAGCGSAPSSAPAEPRRTSPVAGDWDCQQVGEVQWRCQPAQPAVGSESPSDGVGAAKTVAPD
jgi:hypothetical protein